MKEETKIFFIVSVLIIFLMLLISTPSGIPEPEEFVTNRTFTNHSDLFYSYEITRYPSSVELVSPTPKDKNVTLGFVIDPWNLKFGIVPTNGSYAKRNIELTNLKETPTRISFNVFGNILPLVSFSQNDFVLYKDQKASVDVYLFTNNTKIGNYSGEIDVIARKPKYDFIPV